eukprot:gene7831-9300_t
MELPWPTIPQELNLALDAPVAERMTAQEYAQLQEVLARGGFVAGASSRAVSECDVPGGCVSSVASSSPAVLVHYRDSPAGHYALGYRIGHLMRNEIRRALQRFKTLDTLEMPKAPVAPRTRPLGKATTKLERQRRVDSFEVLARLLRGTVRTTPQFVLELMGLADGARVSRDRVLLQNFQEELLQCPAFGELLEQIHARFLLPLEESYH